MALDALEPLHFLHHAKKPNGSEYQRRRRGARSCLTVAPKASIADSLCSSVHLSGSKRGRIFEDDRTRTSNVGPA